MNKFQILYVRLRKNIYKFAQDYIRLRKITKME